MTGAITNAATSTAAIATSHGVRADRCGPITGATSAGSSYSTTGSARVSENAGIGHQVGDLVGVQGERVDRGRLQGGERRERGCGRYAHADGVLHRLGVDQYL